MDVRTVSTLHTKDDRAEVKPNDDFMREGPGGDSFLHRA
jgi:hypothetical protein